MYNNRRNNRFNIFIGAIIVSLLVLLTGCTSTKRKIDLTKPVAEDSSNPVTLTVYLKIFQHTLVPYTWHV